MEWKIDSLEDLEPVAQYLLSLSKEHPIITFQGEMGAGKTTLIAALTKVAGIVGQASSPTFSIVNEYTSTNYGIIYHFDCYRFNDATEALQIGLEEYLSSGAICLIEWPEKIDNLLPSGCVKVQIELKQDTSRIISLTT